MAQVQNITDAVAKAKVKQEKQAKEREAREARINAMPANQVTSPAKVSGDQKVVKADAPAPAKVTSGDQNDAPAKPKRKKSAGYLAYVATPDQPLTGKITFLGDCATKNPKRRNAATKFALYKNNMTVGEYIEASVAIGTAKAVAMDDVRWDIAHNFITVK
jgi:hypothetical protein